MRVLCSCVSAESIGSSSTAGLLLLILDDCKYHCLLDTLQLTVRQLHRGHIDLNQTPDLPNVHDYR
jgi:hypothetical protein